MEICRLIVAQPKVTFVGGRILAKEATDCIYFQWRADTVVGVPELEGLAIDMHITFMYMHKEPRWQEALAGMQEQWNHFSRKSGAGLSAPLRPLHCIDHTESSWRLSDFSTEERAMLELKVGSRLYQALQQCVAVGVQKLPVPNRPNAWRFRSEFHLSVLAWMEV